MKSIPAHRIEFATTVKVTVSDGSEEERDVTVTADISAYDPGKLYGPPETCYPAEGGTAELVSVIDDETGEDLLPRLDRFAVDTLETEAGEHDHYEEPEPPDRERD